MKGIRFEYIYIYIYTHGLLHKEIELEIINKNKK